MIEESKFVSPIYKGISGIACFDLAPQESNPNSMNSKSFSALQMSIFNSGYLLPINVIENTKFSEKDSLCYSNIEKLKNMLEDESSSNNTYSSNGSKLATELKNNNIYRYVIVDGTQRSLIVKLGTLYFLSLQESQQERLSSEWSKGNGIPEEPGKEMLMYIAWRENFKLPCVVIEDKDEIHNMSTTVLMNTARGSHSFHSIKDIVYNLINNGKVDAKWISKNLFLDIESVDRILQLNGIKTAYSDHENIELSWNPEDSYSYKQKESYYLKRECLSWLEDNNYLEEFKDSNMELFEFGKTKGWDYNFHKNAVRQRDIKLAPNGTRAGKGEGRIINGFIPK